MTRAWGSLQGLYRGRTAVLATMHRKEEAVAAPLAELLGLCVIAPEGINTDALGAFSGEVLRQGTIDQAAVAKARLGMAMTGLPIGIASEGAFGPHPRAPFIPAGIESLVFVDDERGIVVTEHLIEEQTNFAHVIANDINKVGDFLSRVGFPEHALVVGPNAPSSAQPQMYKGIRSQAELATAIRSASSASTDGQALVQTDMRAHQNPKRMSSIGRLADRLARRILTPCPGCQAPGFGQIGVVAGLPCEACEEPTSLVRHETFGCAACDYREQRPRSDGLEFAEPGWCPRCNP